MFGPDSHLVKKEKCDGRDGENQRRCAPERTPHDKCVSEHRKAKRRASKIKIDKDAHRMRIVPAVTAASTPGATAAAAPEAASIGTFFEPTRWTTWSKAAGTFFEAAGVEAQDMPARREPLRSSESRRFLSRNSAVRTPTNPIGQDADLGPF